jgi:hypothetical protein
VKPRVPGASSCARLFPDGRNAVRAREPGQIVRLRAYQSAGSTGRAYTPSRTVWDGDIIGSSRCRDGVVGDSEKGVVVVPRVVVVVIEMGVVV